MKRFYLPLLIAGGLLLSCARKSEMEEGVVVKDVVIENSVEEIPPPPPPPPGYKPPYTSIKAWLNALCLHETPADSVEIYSFNVFSSKDDSFLCLSGVNHYSHGTVSESRISFVPSTECFLLPRSEYGNRTKEELQNSITAQLKSFVRSAQFRRSFFAKAKAVVTEYNGEQLYGSR